VNENKKREREEFNESLGFRSRHEVGDEGAGKGDQLA